MRNHAAVKPPYAKLAPWPQKDQFKLSLTTELTPNGYSLAGVLRRPPNSGVSGGGPVNPDHLSPHSAGRPGEGYSPPGPKRGARGGGAPELVLWAACKPHVQRIGYSRICWISREGRAKLGQVM